MEPGITELLQALADPTRRAIVENLARQPLTVGRITALLPVSQSAVSQHLKLLDQARLVRRERRGREMIYSLRPEALARLGQYLSGLGQLAGGPAPPSMDEQDHVDLALGRWRELWPQYDSATVALIARLLLLSRVMDRLASGSAAHQGISRTDVIVLGTLRRIGPPHESTAAELSRTAVLSAPGMSQRLDVLERRGLVKRLPSREDGRASVVRLTAKGVAVNDKVVHEQMSGNYAAFFEMPEAERLQLSRSLRSLLRRLEGASARGGKRGRG